jgi:DNA-binding MarR family transcriptional regulator
MAPDRDPESTNPKPSPGGEQQLKRLVRLSHIFSSVVHEILETKLLEETTPLPLTTSQFHVLKLMTVNGDHQIGELAEFLGISAPAASKNVDKLERFGLVLRKQSTGDRRAVILSASLKGRRLVEHYEALIESRLSLILEEFTPEEINRFSELLERFSVSILKRERTHRGFCLRCAAYIETGCPVGHVRGVCPYDTFRKTDAKTHETS